MSRLGFFVALCVALAVVSACEPQNVAVAPPSSPSAAPTAATTQAPGDSGASFGPSTAAGGASHSAGESTVTTTGTTTVVAGHGPILASTKFALTGNVKMSLSTCGSSGTFPFIWVYTEFNATVGQYVEQVSHIKNLKGNYYLHVVSPPECEWTVTLAAE